MSIIRSLLRLAAAEILCLFINMTFAVSTDTFIRLVCLVCTVLILCAVMADHGLRSAKSDVKAQKGGISYKSLAASAAAVTALPLMSWILLFISAKSGAFEFYGLHKLLNAPFLQYYNLIDVGTSSARLTSGKLLLMLAPVFVPAAVLSAVYIPAVRAELSDGNVK